MYLKLQDVLDDPRASLALRRLHNVVRLQKIGAPALVVGKSQDLLRESICEFGPKFIELEKFLSEYQVWADDEDLRENEWQARCTGCSSWNDNEQVDSDKWCEKHSFQSKSYPDECLDYSAVEVN